MDYRRYLITEKNVKLTPEDIKALKGKFKKGKNKITTASTDNRSYFTIMKMVQNDPEETYGWEITKDDKNYIGTHWYTMNQADDESPDKSENFKIPVSQGTAGLMKKLEKEFK